MPNVTSLLGGGLSSILGGSDSSSNPLSEIAKVAESILGGGSQAGGGSSDSSAASVFGEIAQVAGKVLPFLAMV